MDVEQLLKGYEQLKERPTGQSQPGRTISLPATRYDILSMLRSGPIVGVEVGTDTGINARELLLSRQDLFLWTVDPWLPTPEFPEEGRVTALRYYEERVGEFVRAGRTKHLRLSSVDAAMHLSGRLRHEGQTRCMSFDFVYVDGDHHEGAVAEDIAAWWPLLLRGGLMAGHDFEDPGVCVPVVRFARDQRLDLHVINEHGDPDMVPQELRGPHWTPGHGFDRWGGWAHPSWFFFKP